MSLAPKLYYYDTGSSSWKDITEDVVEPGLNELVYSIDNRVQGNAVFFDVILTTECSYYGEGKYKLQIGTNYILLGAPGDGIKIDLIKDRVHLTLVDYLFYILTGLAPLKVGATDVESLSGEAVIMASIDDIVALYDMTQGVSGNQGNVRIDGFSSRDGENFYDGLGNTVNVIEENVRYRSKGAVKGKTQVSDLGQAYVNVYDILKNIVEGSGFNYNLINDYQENSGYHSVSTSGISNQKKVWDCKVVNGIVLQLSSGVGAVGIVSWILDSGTVYADVISWDSRDWDEGNSGEDFIAYQMFPDYDANAVYVVGWYCSSYSPAGSNSYRPRIIRVYVDTDGTLTEDYVDDYPTQAEFPIVGSTMDSTERTYYRDRDYRFKDAVNPFCNLTYYTDAEFNKFYIIWLYPYVSGGYDGLYVINPYYHYHSLPYDTYIYDLPDDIDASSYLPYLVPDWINGSVALIYYCDDAYYKKYFYKVNMSILQAGYSVGGDGGRIHTDDDFPSNTLPPIATWRESLYYTNTIPGTSGDFYYFLSQLPNGVLGREGAYNNYTEEKGSYFTNNYDHDVDYGGSSWDYLTDRVFVWSTDSDVDPSSLRWDYHENYTYKRMYLYQPAIYSDQKQQLIDMFATAGLFYEQKDGAIRFFRIRGIGTNLATIQDSDFINCRDIEEFSNFADEYSIKVLTKRITKESGNSIQNISTLANDYGFVSKLNAKWFSDWTAYLLKSFPGKEFAFDLNHFFALTNTYLPNLGDILTYDSNKYMIVKVTLDLIKLKIFIQTIKPSSLQATSPLWVVGGNTTNTMAWSEDGETWNGLGSPVFDSVCCGVAFNGTLWVATGQGSVNTLAHSADGKVWTGLGKTIFPDTGYDVVWNGSLWLALGTITGSGSHTMAWSENGVDWTGLGVSIFDFYGHSAVWDGSMFVAVGGFEAPNTIAWSNDGKSWTGLGISIFDTAGLGVAYNGSIYVAAGYDTNTLAYSYDGKTWYGLGKTIFTSVGRNVAWSGSVFVAVGEGTNTIAWSDDGLTWHGLGTSIFDTRGFGVKWNGTKFVAFGMGSINTMAYSYDGKTWYGLGKTIFGNYAHNGACRPAPQLIPAIS